MNPIDVFTAPRYNWRGYLQNHLVWSGVNVSDLHPIMGLRLAALMHDLTNDGLASETPGHGWLQITSGVRTQAQQIALYNDICLRQGRCSYVANPYAARSSGPDQEGVLRYGSNHMAQRQSDLWGRAVGHGRQVWVGHAVDFRNNGVSWGELHYRLGRWGLDWPLKTGAVEPWHVEAFPDRSPHSTGWIPGPWPTRPGVHRPLYIGCRGGDVKRLQRMLGLRQDGAYGTGTARAVRRARRMLGLARTFRRADPWWNVEAQVAWQRAPESKRRAIRRG